MSFIYENKLLLQALLEASGALEKKAQDNEQAKQNILENFRDFNQNQEIVKALPDYDLALKLLYNLQRELKDPKAPPAGIPIGTQSGSTQIEANTANFRTLGDFLNWAAANKLTWKNQRFAWTKEEADKDRSIINNNWTFTSLPFDRNDRSLDRQPIKTIAYANKDALIEYLSALRDSPETQKNNVLKFMLASLIGEANGFLRIQGEKPIETKTSPKPADNLDPNLIVDILPAILGNDTINENLNNAPFNLFKADNVNALTVEDLKSKENFTNWLINRQIKVNLGGKNPTTKVVKVFDPESGDPCLAVHILYKRALHLRNSAQGYDQFVTNYSKAINLYINAVTAFGREFSDKNGHPCTVLSPTSDTNAKVYPGGSGSLAGGARLADPATTGPSSGNPQVKSQMLKNLVQYMPLNLHTINLDDILAFFNAYVEFLEKTSGAEEEFVKTAQSSVISIIQEIKKVTVLPQLVFPLNGGSETVVKWIRNPLFSYTPFIQNLSEILVTTFSVIQKFYDTYGRVRSSEDKAEFNSEQQNIVKGQTPIYNSNMRVINRWLNEAGRVQGFKK